MGKRKKTFSGRVAAWSVAATTAMAAFLMPTTNASAGPRDMHAPVYKTQTYQPNFLEKFIDMLSFRDKQAGTPITGTRLTREDKAALQFIQGAKYRQPGAKLVVKNVGEFEHQSFLGFGWRTYKTQNDILPRVLPVPRKFEGQDERLTQDVSGVTKIVTVVGASAATGVPCAGPAVYMGWSIAGSSLQADLPNLRSGARYYWAGSKDKIGRGVIDTVASAASCGLSLGSAAVANHVYKEVGSKVYQKVGPKIYAYDVAHRQALGFQTPAQALADAQRRASLIAMSKANHAATLVKDTMNIGGHVVIHQGKKIATQKLTDHGADAKARHHRIHNHPVRPSTMSAAGASYGQGLYR